MGSVVVNQQINKNCYYTVKKYDQIALNTKILNKSFYLIQQKYDNLC
jgi:hypothetical protein